MSDTERLIARFLRYVKIHSSSAEGVEDRYPSTPEQLELSKCLADEMRQMGLSDVTLDSNGYVFGTLPGNMPKAANVPVVGLIAHVDTYPGVSGKGVKPILHKNYDGKDIVLPGDPAQVILVHDNQDLMKYVGETVITSDGTTLLGADDKAGIAEILEAVERLKKSDKPRPTVRIAFTPDEEVGNGTKFFDIKAFGADVAYTADGSAPEEVENETFCADSATITITGHDVHPGYARGKMVNAIRLASRFIDLVPPGMCPEFNTGRSGFLHPVGISGDVSQAVVRLIVRDFSLEGLRAREDFLRQTAAALQSQFRGANIKVEVKESYRNMKFYLDKDPRVVEMAMKAVEATGLEPKLTSIRGGTDGSKLSQMGLPTPNIGGGGKNFHSKKEWISVPILEQCTKVIVELVHLWGENSR